MEKWINKNILLLILLILAPIGAFFAFGQKSVLYAQLDKWKLIPRPERFTELYFDDHANLPKRIQKDETISFSFVIHNLEGEKWKYPYAVFFLAQDGQITNIEETSVVLADGEYKKITESYTSAFSENKGNIFVELQQPKQELHFSLNDND